jgi:hypothetical protein
MLSSNLLSNSVKITVYAATALLLVLRKLAFDNREQRGILEADREEVTEGWTKLHNELNNLYCQLL